MNNTNVLKPGDRCFFDVFGESDIYDTYIVTVVKKLRKDLYVVTSNDTNVTFECPAKLLTPYSDCRDMKDMIILRNANNSLFDAVDIDIVEKMKGVIDSILDHPEEALKDKAFIKDIKNAFDHSMDSLLCRISLSIRNQNESSTLKRIYNKEFKNTLALKDKIEKFNSSTSPSKVKTVDIDKDFGSISNAISTVTAMINHYYFEELDLSGDEVSFRTGEEIHDDIANHISHFRSDRLGYGVFDIVKTIMTYKDNTVSNLNSKDVYNIIKGSVSQVDFDRAILFKLNSNNTMDITPLPHSDYIKNNMDECIDIIKGFFRITDDKSVAKIYGKTLIIPISEKLWEDIQLAGDEEDE